MQATKVMQRTIKPLAAPEGFKFGCDPEMFVVKDGTPVSAAGLIPGTKAHPHRVPGGAVQVDGMAAEINIDPSETFAEFSDRLDSVLSALRGMLPSGHDLLFVPSLRFDPAVFDSAPDEAKELGCQPDFNAWTGGVNPPPHLPKDKYLRCAGGHLHIGWTEGAMVSNPAHIMHCRDLVKQLDWYLGAWSLHEDPDTDRRKLYGKAGSFRPKSYGVEYRSLSNFWVSDPVMRVKTWNRMVRAIDDMRTSFMPDRNDKHNALLITSINTSERHTGLERAYSYPIQNIGSRRGLGFSKSY